MATRDSPVVTATFVPFLFDGLKVSGERVPGRKGLYIHHFRIGINFKFLNVRLRIRRRISGIEIDCYQGSEGPDKDEQQEAEGESAGCHE